MSAKVTINYIEQEHQLTLYALGNDYALYRIEVEDVTE